MIENNKEIKLLFVGDIFIDDDSSKLKLSKEIRHIIDGHDIKVCNFECPVATDQHQSMKKYGMPLSQSSEAAKFVLSLGFDTITIATNHIMDFGEDGLKATLNSFKECDVIGAGLNFDDVYKPAIRSIAGKKIGFINAAEKQYGTAEQYDGMGYAWLFSHRLFKNISILRKECDYVVLISHAGAENMELPLPEWRDAYKMFIDLGVDIIIGHHPHVIQGWEKYNNGLIFYSLGNFIWMSSLLKDKWESKTIIVSITISENKINYSVLPIDIVEDTIVLIEDDEFTLYLQSLCDILENTQLYINEVNAKVIDLYNKRFKNILYKISDLSSSTKITSRFKSLIKNLLKHNRINPVNAYIYLNNETIRWLLSRVMKIKGYFDVDTTEGE